MNIVEAFLNVVADHWEAVLALCALFLTCWQTIGMHRHNKLSVQPHLTTWANQDDNGGFYIVRFELLNNGLGPAIMKHFEVFFDGKKIGSNFDKLTLEKNIENILKQCPGIIRHTISTIGLDFPVPANYKETLLEIHVPTHTQFDKKPYQEFIDKFDAEFYYQSMYGQKFFYHTYSAADLKSWPLKIRLFFRKRGINF